MKKQERANFDIATAIGIQIIRLIQDKAKNEEELERFLNSLKLKSLKYRPE